MEELYRGYSIRLAGEWSEVQSRVDRSSPFTKEIFYIGGYWTEYLSIYMDKNNLNLQSCGNGQTVLLSNGVILPQTVIVEKSTSNSSRKANNHRARRAGYHCYCSLRDEDGDHTLMSLCTNCDRWFHVQCLNIPTLSTQQLQRLESFSCASCQFLRGELNYYCYEPAYEWKYKKTHSPETSSDQKLQIQLNGKKEDQTQLWADLLVAYSEFDANPVQDDWRQLISAVHQNYSQLPLKKRSTYYLTIEEVDKLLEESLKLPLQWSPAISLLSMAKEFVQHWMNKVHCFYRSTFPQIKDFVIQLHSGGVQLESGTVTERWRQIHQFLEQLLVFYVDLQILHIKPTSYLHTLRQSIWVLSVLPFLLRRKKIDHLAIEANGTNPLSDWKQLNKILYYGDSLLKKVKPSRTIKCFDSEGSSSFDFAINSDLLSILTDVLRGYRYEGEHLIGTISALSSTRSTMEEIDSLFNTCYLFNLTVDLSSESPFKLLQCIRRPSSLWMKSTLDCNIVDGVEGMYCWCRGGDNGLEMICCDGCDEWFHFECVGMKAPQREKRKKVAKSKETSKKRRKSSQAQDITVLNDLSIEQLSNNGKEFTEASTSLDNTDEHAIQDESVDHSDAVTSFYCFSCKIFNNSNI